MRVLIITQDDPFYLADNLNYLFNIPSDDISYVGCVLLSPSPFGKKNESFLMKAFNTYKIFGLIFFLTYSLRFLLNKFKKNTKVRNILNRHNIPCISLNKSINSNESLSRLSEFKPDLIVSIAGNEIFKKPLINLAPFGCLNLHTALLPKYRGLMPSFWVLRNNEKETGVSVFFVDEGIDSGKIIVQEAIPIDEKSQEELIRTTKKIGMDLINRSIVKIINNDLDFIDNPDEKSTYFGFPTKKDVIAFKKAGKRFF